MTTTNSPTTPNGRTRLRYDERGRLVEQSLPPGIWQQGPQPAIPTRPRNPAPTPLQDILAQVQAVEAELAEATAAYERSLEPGNADPFLAEKVELVKQINALRAKLSPLETRLKEIESTPPPAQQFKLSVARAEQQTNGAARLLTRSLAEEKSDELHQQPLESLSRETQKQILNRRDVSVVKDVAATGFARFNRIPEEVRTAEAAKSTAARIVEAIALIVSTIKSHVS
jgi:YD repeat-containing protein